MTASIESESTAEAPEFFRCPVQSGHGDAEITAGRRKCQAVMQEQSIDGYTVLVKPKDAAKLRVGKPWKLDYDGAILEVHPQWFFNSPDGHVQIALRRLRDLTPAPPIGKSWLVRFGGRRYEDPSLAAIAFGGFVLFLFSLMSLPGLGDRLGTSKRIQNSVRWIVNEVDVAIDSIL